MTDRSPPPSRAPMVAIAVSAACLTYGASLIVQRSVPSLKDVLGVALAGGVKPTYYLRVASSLALGALAGFLARNVSLTDRTLALITGISVLAALILVATFR